MNTAQLIGIMTYEFKMHWRRRALIAITLVMGLLVAAGILIFSASASDFEVMADNTAALTDLITFQTWAPLGVLLALIFPVMVADTVPLDQHTKMDEMFKSMPLTPRVYLAGKVAGVWAAAGSAILVVMVLGLIGWRVMVGAFNYAEFFSLWLLGALPLMALNGGLAVLIAATQPSRRRAALLMMGIMALSFVFGFSTGTWWDYVNLVRAPVLEYYMTIDEFQPANARTAAQVALMFGVGAVQLLLVWAGVSTWMNRKH